MRAGAGRACSVRQEGIGRSAAVVVVVVVVVVVATPFQPHTYIYHACLPIGGGLWFPKIEYCVFQPKSTTTKRRMVLQQGKSAAA